MNRRSPRPLARLLMLLVVVLTFVAPMLTPTVSAQQGVTAWVESSTTRPGVGCAVEVSVEVRSGGAAVDGVAVSVALSEDGTTNVLSADRTTTNATGVGWLTLDTGNAWSGAKLWMEVVVGGTYLGGQTVRVTDGGCGSGGGSLLEMDGSVSVIRAGASSGTSSGSTSGPTPDVAIPGVVTYQQQRPLSCEYAALSIATGALGGWVDEYAFDGVIPLSSNPHFGYRGDINGSWGNTDDYGIYAAPLGAALPRFGFTGHTFFGAGSNDELVASIDAGRPTLVWLGLRGDISQNAYSSDGIRFQLTQYMHVMVAYGYSDTHIFLSDPGSGRYVAYDWATFMGMWNVMDGMALGVSR